MYIYVYVLQNSLLARVRRVELHFTLEVVLEVYHRRVGSLVGLDGRRFDRLRCRNHVSRLLRVELFVEVVGPECFGDDLQSTRS